MKTTRSCKNCIWGDRCGEGRACEDYTPFDDYELSIPEYRTYEKEMEEEYFNLVNEQNPMRGYENKQSY